jgi:hypothetical protein
MNRIQWAACALLVLSAGPSPAAEYVYLAETPGECFLEYTPAQYSICIHSGAYSDVTGVSFRLECERFGPAQVSSLTAAPGVTIVGGSLFGGITLAFDAPRALAHDAVLTVTVSSQEVYGAAWTKDVVLQRGAVPVALADFRTEGWPFDCIGTFAHWDLPDTVSVPVDRDDAFLFRTVVSTASYPPNATVTIDDPAGWVIADFNDDVLAKCGYCPWDWTTVTVPTHVPSGVADGTLNEITVVMSSFGAPVDERTVVLRAVKPVAAETKTIGGVKALYR